MTIHDFIYLLLSLLVVYIYAGYPLVLAFLSRFFSKEHTIDRNYLPSVTLVISAFNEADVIREKLQNALTLDYPSDKLKIIVVSDCSTDATDDIVRGFMSSGVSLLRTRERNGKTSGLNEVMEQIRTEIVVFSDANAIYDNQAIRHLVKHFADAKTGYVVGHARYVEDNSAAGKSESGYWDYEVRLKKQESDFSSVVGGDGAIYAIRSELWEPLLETDINDFVNPLQIIVKGFRGIFEPEAWCTERPAGDFEKEFERKKRIVNRSFNGVLRVPGCLNPFQVGRFAWLLLSHKVLRWFSAFFIAVHWLMSLVGLFLPGRFTSVYFFVLVLYYLSMMFALLGEYQAKVKAGAQPLFYYPYYLFMVTYSAAKGVFLRLRGEVIFKWQTVRDGQTHDVVRGGLPEMTLVCCLFFTFCGLLVCLLKHAHVETLGAYFLATVLLYSYIGYPVLLSVIALFFTVRHLTEEVNLPTLTLLVIAYNEEKYIRDKIENSLSLDYPKDRYRIIVASDGSWDATNDILREYESKGVDVKIFPENRGKIVALNHSMHEIDTELVVFSDANVMYEGNALIKLAANFADKRVGVVSGRVVLVNDSLSYSDAENSYYGLEHYIQFKEGQTGALVGADGAMYAIRRSLFSPPPEDTILDDFVISMQISSQGYMALHENMAIGYEQNEQEIEKEFRRKQRIIAGGYQVLGRGRGVPSFKTRILLFNFFSHKVLRWLSGPLFLVFVAALIAQQLLGSNDMFLSTCLYVTIFSIFITGIAHVSHRFRALSLPGFVYYQYMLILASLAGCWKGITRGQQVTWRQAG